MHSESGQKILISLGCWIMGYILTEAIQYNDSQASPIN